MTRIQVADERTTERTAKKRDQRKRQRDRLQRQLAERTGERARARLDRERLADWIDEHTDAIVDRASSGRWEVVEADRNRTATESETCG